MSENIQPLTKDDIETIRIHLSAIKEKLCNDRRWKEAEEYDGLIVRFMAFATAPSQSDWNEMTVICDCCGHAIHVKRETK